VNLTIESRSTNSGQRATATRENKTTIKPAGAVTTAHVSGTNTTTPNK
jgi:hypothetical protein